MYVSYQLLRNVLAAQALDLSFCLLLDARRPDLIEDWYEILRCIRTAELRSRRKICDMAGTRSIPAMSPAEVSGSEVRNRVVAR
jgi:hypothetical protein